MPPRFTQDGPSATPPDNGGDQPYPVGYDVNGQPVYDAGRPVAPEQPQAAPAPVLQSPSTMLPSLPVQSDYPLAPEQATTYDQYQQAPLEYQNNPYATPAPANSAAFAQNPYTQTIAQQPPVDPAGYASTGYSPQGYPDSSVTYAGQQPQTPYYSNQYVSYMSGPGGQPQPTAQQFTSSDVPLVPLSPPTAQNMPASHQSVDDAIAREYAARNPVAPKKSHIGLIIGIITAVVLLLGVGGFILFQMMGQQRQQTPATLLDEAFVNALRVGSYQRTVTAQTSGTTDQTPFTTRAVFTSTVDVTQPTKPKVKGDFGNEQTMGNDAYSRIGEFVYSGDDKQYVKLSNFNQPATAPKTTTRLTTEGLEKVKSKWVSVAAKGSMPAANYTLLQEPDIRSLTGFGDDFAFAKLADDKAASAAGSLRAAYTVESSEKTVFKSKEMLRYKLKIDRKKQLTALEQLYGKENVTGHSLNSYSALTAYIDTETKLPVRVEVDQDGSNLVIDYAKFNEKADITEPKDAITVSKPDGTGAASAGSGAGSQPSAQSAVPAGE